MSIEVREVLSERRYAAGYILRREIWVTPDGESVEIKAAYTHSGDYIGNSKEAYRLCKSFGIKPEKRSPDHSVCSIGFCEKEQKWYGWSHRAIYGFGIGDNVKQGDCAYTPVDRDDFDADMVRFWSDDFHESTEAARDTRDGVEGVQIDWLYSDQTPNEKIRNKIGGVFQPYPETWGRGEWTAKTLGDAKQMACDFAEGV